MFNMVQLRRWLFGLRADRSQSLVLRRPNLNSLEDRLPPGDVLLTSLFAGGLSFFDDLIPPPYVSGASWIRPSVDTDELQKTSTVSSRLLVSAELPLDREPIADLEPRSRAFNSLVISSFGEDSSSRFANGFSSIPQTINQTVSPGTSATVGGAFTRTPVSPQTQFTSTDLMPVSTGAVNGAIPRTASSAVDVAESRTSSPPNSGAEIPAVTDSGTTAGVGSTEAEKAREPEATREFTSTEILVGVRSEDPLAAVREWAATVTKPSLAIDSNASRVLLTSDGVATVEVSLAEGADPLAAVDFFASAPWAAWAQPNYVVRDGQDFTPNDPDYPDPGQYFHLLAQTDVAWDTTTGDPSILVGIADDGLAYNHPDLAANVWSNPNDPLDGVDNDSNGFIDDIRGWDFNANDNNPIPSGADTHGTHVGGIVGARTNNAIGVAGTAGGNGAVGTPTGARLVPLKWAGPNGWTSSMVAQTYQYAANNGVRIVNASYNFDFWVSGGVADPAVDAAMTFAYNQGVLLMNSAGNNSELNPTRGIFTQPLFVASLNSADVRSSFSNYGNQVDISANGELILSTITSADGTGVDYELNSGTSMSTPHAAGVAALIWSQNPSWTRDQVAAQLLGTADSVDAIAGNIPGTLGTGRVNAFRGVDQSILAPVFNNLTLTPVANNPTQTASVTVNVPRRLNPSSVLSSNIELRSDGADNTFDTADDVTYPVTINGGAIYRIGTNGLTLTRTDGLPLVVDRYRLTGLSGASGFRDPFGATLDGDANGSAGGNYVAVFGANPQITGTAFEDTNGNGARDANDPGLANRTLFLDTNGNSTLDVTSTSFSNNTPVTIPDVTTVTSAITVSGITGPIADVNVRVNIAHTFDSDLDVFLIAPDGTRVELFTAVGAGGDNFTNTVLDDEAGASIGSGSAPFTGSFRPEGSLAALDGKVANGQWTLEVTDAAEDDTGTLNGWEVTVSNSEPVAVTDAGGSYAFLELANGTYSVRTALPSGWVATAPAGGSYSVNITSPAELFSGRDFGTARNNRFYGYVWDDLNANGTVDSGEPPVAGRFAFIDTNGNGTLDNAANSFLNSTPVTITDVSTVTSATSVSGMTGPIVDVNVRVNITHTFNSDLDVFLIAPDGTRVELFTDVGGGSANFTNTVFDDEAATSITGGAAPFTGSFRPEGSLAALDGKLANGQWTLEITDDAGFDTGTLNNWEVTIATSEPSVGSTASGNALLEMANGANTIRLTPLAGWKFTSPAGGVYSVTATGTPIYDQRFGVAEAVAPTVSTVAISPSGAQRSRVNSLTVTFSERVTLPGTPASAFTLTRAGSGPVALNASVDNTGPATIVTLTFADTAAFGSLIDGDYTLTVLSAQVQDIAQNPMGSNATHTFHRLFGDLNGDRFIDGTDGAQFGSTFGLQAGDTGFLAAFDFNNDGFVDGTDGAQFGSRFGTGL